MTSDGAKPWNSSKASAEAVAGLLRAALTQRSNFAGFDLRSTRNEGFALSMSAKESPRLKPACNVASSGMADAPAGFFAFDFGFNVFRNSALPSSARLRDLPWWYAMPPWAGVVRRASGRDHGHGFEGFHRSSSLSRFVC